ncbi:MAG: SDR family NAD(P)-dependent oxidoreductase [Gammaproteobacteria bacterium]
MQKTILITGCSSGIGLCAAEILQKKGYRVFATARKDSDLVKLKSLGLETVLLDVNDSDSIRRGLNDVLEKTGGTLDALFNNAGFAQAGAVEDLTRDMMREQFETNVFGAMELTNLVVPVMRKQGHGRIIQNTSILGIVAMPFRGAYNASKFALEGFTHTLRQELYNTGIFVSIIAPGPIHSNLRKNALLHYEENLSQRKSIHRDLYTKMEKYFFKLTASEKRFTQGPDAVVKKLICALESKHPKAHYYVTFSAHLFAVLRRILPDSALDALMVKINRSEMGE